MPTSPQQAAITRLLRSLADELLISTEMLSYTGPRTELGKIRAVEREAARRRREQYQQIQYLKRKKWVQVKKTQKGLFVALSDQGKSELFARTAKSRPKLSDGKVCLLIYDFPESARQERDALRYFIKTLGFKQVQMSVWQTDRDCVKDVERFIEETKISRWVKLFVGQEK